jgi:2-methylcitrate dehydratase PrpD
MWTAEKLARFVARSSYDDIPPAARQKAIDTIANNVGNIFAALQHPQPKMVLKVAEEIGGKPQSTAVGLSTRVGAQTAAYINAILCDSLQNQDIVIPPTAHVWQFVEPAALAMAEACGASGKELIAGLVLGVEICVRLGVNLKYHLESEVFGFGWSSVAAAAAAAKIAGLTEEQIAHAISLAAMNATVPCVHMACNTHGYLRQPNEIGAPSQTAIVSAWMAKGGYISPLDVFDSRGAFHKMMGCEDLNIPALLDGLGKEWQCTRSIFKFLPQCCLHFPAAEATEAALKKGKFDLREIKNIRVRTLSWIAGKPFNDPRPEDIVQASLSLPLGVAASLLGIKPLWRWMDADVFRSPEVREVMAKITIEGAPEFDEPFRNGYQNIGASVELVTDRSAASETVHLQLDSYKIQRMVDLQGFFRGVSTPRLDKKACEEFLASLQRLPEIANVRELTEFLLKVQSLEPAVSAAG